MQCVSTTLFFFEFAHKQISAVSILDACQAAWVYFGRWAWLSNIVAVVQIETHIWLFKKRFLPGFFCGVTIVAQKKKQHKKISLLSRCLTSAAQQRRQDRRKKECWGLRGETSGYMNWHRPHRSTLMKLRFNVSRQRRGTTAIAGVWWKDWKNGERSKGEIGAKNNNKMRQAEGGDGALCVCQSELQRWEGLRCRAFPASPPSSPPSSPLSPEAL